MADVQYTWSKESQRFRDLSTGRYVSERTVRDLVDKVADLASQRMGEAAARYRTGAITIDAFQAEMFATIKDSQIAAAMLAHGGRSQMGPAEWGQVGQRIRTQYAYARQMIGDILDGRQRVNGRLDARARQYGQAARATYERIRGPQSAGAGMQFERNVLGAAEHCDSCVNQTAQGWVPIGTLVPVGSRSCRGNCRCTISYSRTRDAQEAA